jgi:ATP-dependent DNA ligase
LKVRRRLLERFIGGHGMIFAVRRPSRNGLKAWEKAVARGFEGIVAKNPESRYVPGRTRAWLKVKQPHYREGERGGEPKQ